MRRIRIGTLIILCCLIMAIVLGVFLSIWTVKYQAWEWRTSTWSDAPKALWWDITILDKERAQTELLEKISQVKIEVIDKSNNSGIQNIIWLMGLEDAVKILPSRIFDLISSHEEGPLTIIAVGKLDNGWGGYFLNTNQFFILADKTNFSFSWYRYAFIHDIGHAYHYALGGWSFSPPDIFQDIREKEEPPTEYAKKDYLEDFAETFVLYFLNPGHLRENFPLRYMKMQKILSQ